MTTTWMTGATGGIGAAIARQVYQRGDRLVLLGRDRGRLADTAAELLRTTALDADLREPEVLQIDLSQPESLDSAVRSSIPECLDVLIHCAGTVELGTIAETTAQTWQTTLAVNLTGPAELTRILLPALRAARGHVVLVNSTAGLSAGACWGSYAASKFGLRAFAEALRTEEHENGVRVTTIYPGRTATPMQEKVRRMEHRPYDPEAWARPDSTATVIMTALNLPRDAEVTDVTVRPGAR